MSLQSLIATGTKVWLDSIDPDLIKTNFAQGASGATSNPIIISDLIKTGRFDADLAKYMAGHDDSAVAWLITDQLVKQAQAVFLPVWEKTTGNNGYVSFELDPLLEDTAAPIPHAQRVSSYVELAKHWAAGHKNRMIKIPATPAGLDALEAVAAESISLNVTLIFSDRQYQLAREAVWRGASRRKNGTDLFKSVYSIFVSRVDVYTEKKVPDLSPAAQGLVGIVNAKRMWHSNQTFWAAKKLKLQQEIIFASTGTKKPTDAPDKYVAALAGSDIQTNPPATNAAVEKSTTIYSRMVDKMPDPAILAEIDAKVDPKKLEETLMSEGTAKFADPQHALLKLIAEKRAALK